MKIGNLKEKRFRSVTLFNPPPPLQFGNRTEHEEKEELVRPEWMNKPREEMNEEERKLVKDFEKKLATFKV